MNSTKVVSLCALALVSLQLAAAFGMHDKHPLDFASKQPKGSLAGQVVLITGGSSGIGESAARILALHGGAKVVVTARRMDKLQKVVDAIKASGGDALAVKLDVLKNDDFKTAFAKAEEHYGEINHVLANAGTTTGLSWDDDVERSGSDADWLMKLNYGGVRKAFSYALQAFRKHGKGGSFIATSSGASVIPRDLYGAMPMSNFGDYGASKAAINAFIRSLKPLEKENIRVYSLPIMVFESELVRKVLEEPWIASMGIKTLSQYANFNPYFTGAAGRGRDFGLAVQRLMAGGELPFPSASNIMVDGYVAFSTHQMYKDIELDGMWAPDFSQGLFDVDMEPMEFSEEDRQRRIKQLQHINDDVARGSITKEEL